MAVLGETCVDGPAFSQISTTTVLAWAGGGGVLGASPDLRLNVMSGFRDPANEPKQKTVLEERSDATPAVAWHNGRLFIAWKGVGDGLGRLNVMSSEDLSLWSEKQTLDDTCIGGPALASCNGQLLLAWTGGGGLGGGPPDRRLTIAESAGGDWTFNRKTFGYESDAGPALCASRRVRLGFVGRDRRLYIARATADDLGSGNGIKLSKFADQPPNPYHPANANAVETSFARPALAAEITERHWVAWGGDGNTRLNSVLADFQDVDQSDHYGSKRTYTDTTNAAPALLAGALNTSEQTAIVAWRGTDGPGKINVARLDELRTI
jgi:hypothetical protein